MNDIKRAVTNYPVLDIIKNRWSPISFSKKEITQDNLNTILKAATFPEDAGKLEEPFRSMEITPRSRKGLSEIILDHQLN